MKAPEKAFRLPPYVARLGIALLALILMLFSGCAPREALTEAPASPRVFRMNLSTEPPELDPARVTDLTSYNVVLNLMRGLTTFGPGSEVVPAVASHWEVSPDGRRYTFHLRPNARWSDGRPVTAQDFRYAWQRVLTPATGSEYAFFLFDIQNAKAFYDGEIRDFNQVGVAAPNPQTLTVTLAHPLPFFLGLMASPVALPLREDVVTRHGPRFTEAPHAVTNGPYGLAEWRHDERILLKPNPHYFGPRPGVDAVEMLMVNDANTSVVMYENNELDFIETPSSIPSFDVRRLRKRPEYRTQIIHALYYVGFNTRKPPFDNPKVRQAFAAALDRRYFPQLLQSGQKPFTAWITPGLVGHNPTAGVPYQPERARQLLAEAGYPNGKGFPPVTLGFRTMYDIQKECEILQFLWKTRLNVPVRLQNMDWKVYLTRLREEPPELFRLNWYVDYPDADSLMGLFLSDSGNNYTGWKSAAYDHWVKQAARESRPAVRKRLYDAAQRLLLERDAAIVPLYIGEKGYLLKPRFQGLVLNGMNLVFLDGLRPAP